MTNIYINIALILIGMLLVVYGFWQNILAVKWNRMARIAQKEAKYQKSRVSIAEHEASHQASRASLYEKKIQVVISDSSTAISLKEKEFDNLMNDVVEFQKCLQEVRAEKREVEEELINFKGDFETSQDSLATATAEFEELATAYKNLFCTEKDCPNLKHHVFNLCGTHLADGGDTNYLVNDGEPKSILVKEPTGAETLAEDVSGIEGSTPTAIISEGALKHLNREEEGSNEEKN